MSRKELIESAYRRLTEAKADLIVVNDVGKKGAGFGTDTNEVFILDKRKETVHVQLTRKREVAEKILDVVSEKIKPK
jgi:phosphopantothenoylcysteine decarboxylase/phosphopantothenate--cysteine ligase